MRRRSFLGAGLALSFVPFTPLLSQSGPPAVVANVRTPRGPVTVSIWWEGGPFLALLDRGGQRRRYRTTIRNGDPNQVAQALRAGPGRIVLPGRTLALTLDQDGRRLRAGRGNDGYEATVQGVASAMGGGFLMSLILPVALANGAMDAVVRVEAGSARFDATFATLS